MMTALERAAIITEVSQVIFRYGMLMDQGRWEELVQLFAEDAVLVRPSFPDTPIVGRRDILAAFQARPARVARHLFCNVLVDILGPEKVESSCVVSLHSAGPAKDGAALSGVPVIGEYRDSLVRVQDSWCFSSRKGILVQNI